MGTSRNILLETKLVSDIKGTFFVPSYQRGYRWGRDEVRRLLDDVYTNGKKNYCLQPVVVRKKDDSYELIDGQQRVTALMTSLLGISVLDDEYKERVIKIAYNPFAKDDEDIFEVQDQSHLKSKKWIEDISVFFKSDFDMWSFVEKYCEDNPEMTRNEFAKKVTTIQDIKNKELGVIELSADLDIETVTDVFIRINSKGAVLSQADYAMSKIAADEKYGGNVLRKAIDYFCHIAVEPSFYHKLK